jgi:hypothetical protein
LTAALEWGELSAYSASFKMQAAGSSQLWVIIYLTTRRHIEAANNQHIFRIFMSSGI